MWGCRYVFERLISFPLDIFPEVESLSHSSIFNFLKIVHIGFHSGGTYCNPTSVRAQVSFFLTFIPVFVISCLLMTAV